jgi:Septum formation
MRSIGIRLGALAVIAIIAIGAFLLGPYLSGNAGDLKVGDCFDSPATVNAEVQDVQHHPCSDPHSGEVFLVASVPDASAKPDDATMLQFVEDNCVAAYQDYTGVSVDSDPNADIGWFEPTTDGWANGDRTVICYATRQDNSTWTGSLKQQ